jgi:transcriptional regulator with XRE-family HTH domain
MTVMSERIKQAMKLRNKNQAQISRETGIPTSQMSSYVTGKYEPKQTNIFLISKALNVNESWLMGLSDNIDRIPDDMRSLASPQTIEEQKNELIKDAFSVAPKLTQHSIEEALMPYIDKILNEHPGVYDLIIKTENGAQVLVEVKQPKPANEPEHTDKSDTAKITFSEMRKARNKKPTRSELNEIITEPKV